MPNANDPTVHVRRDKRPQGVIAYLTIDDGRGLNVMSSAVMDALAEALTCASFLGRITVAEYLLTSGVDPSAGAATGLDALHWAANRGQFETVRLLLRYNAPLESRNRYGGTVIAMAVWSAIHEPRPDHLRIIQELLKAGACREEAGYPTGNASVDDVIR